MTYCVFQQTFKSEGALTGRAAKRQCVDILESLFIRDLGFEGKELLFGHLTACVRSIACWVESWKSALTPIMIGVADLDILPVSLDLCPRCSHRASIWAVGSVRPSRTRNLAFSMSSGQRDARLTNS